MTSRNNLPHIQAKQFLSGGIEPTDSIAQSEAISVREITHKLLSDTGYRLSRYEIQEVSNIFYGKEKQAPYMDLIRERICKNIFSQLQKSVESYNTMDKDIVFEQFIYQSFLTLENISKSQFIQEKLPALKIQFHELTKGKMPDTLDWLYALVSTMKIDFLSNFWKTDKRVPRSEVSRETSGIWE